MYYLYRHIREDKNEVFYVGIGRISSEITLRRLGHTAKSYYRRAYEKSKSRNDHWKNIVAITNYRIDLVYECETVEEICNKEIEFIELYKDTLCNMTSGGEGITSYKHKQDTKESISRTMKGRKITEKHRENINKRKTKAIWCLSKDGDTMEFNSLKEAAIFLDNPNYIKQISSCLRNKRNQFMEYYWYYKL